MAKKSTISPQSGMADVFGHQGLARQRGRVHQDGKYMAGNPALVLFVFFGAHRSPHPLREMTAFIISGRAENLPPVRAQAPRSPPNRYPRASGRQRPTPPALGRGPLSAWHRHQRGRGQSARNFHRSSSLLQNRANRPIQGNTPKKASAPFFRLRIRQSFDTLGLTKLLSHYSAVASIIAFGESPFQ